MADFQLQWEVEGHKELSRVLIGMESKLKDFTPPLRDSAQYLEKVFSTEVFDTQGAAIGQRWKRLSPLTVAQKARQGLSTLPLIGTGALQAAFRSAVSPLEAVISNVAPYFKYHQSRAPRSRLPRRAMMGLGNDQKTSIVRFFQRHIRESMRKR